MARGRVGYPNCMSDVERPLTEDADRDVDFEEDLDPEAPTDSTLVNPPRDDADRPVPVSDEPDDVLAGSDATEPYQEENAGSSLDQPSDSSS
jgi:hypothetical protein